MIINLNEYKHYLKQMSEIRKLDIEASYVALDECLKTLNINELPELDSIKNQIKVAMKKLENCNG